MTGPFEEVVKNSDPCLALKPNQANEKTILSRRRATRESRRRRTRYQWLL
jgi:hypothetical protein